MNNPGCGFEVLPAATDGFPSIVLVIPGHLQMLGHMAPLKPLRLRRGDVIGLVAPASPPLHAWEIEAGVRYLEGHGYRVELGAHVHDRHGNLAGRDRDRLDDLNRMIRDRQVRAILALRGGYGSPRLLPWIDYDGLRRDPKIIAGYSDLTALQLALWRRIGLVSFSGPMVTSDFARTPDPYTEEQFWGLLTSVRRRRVVRMPDDVVLRIRQHGRAEGRLMAGTLSLLVSNLGTPYSPDYQHALLVLEEVGEALHRLDRMLTQLRNAGVLGRIAGLILGRFTNCSAGDPRRSHLTLREILDEVLTGLDVPVVAGFPYGHVRTRTTVPIGVHARLETAGGRIELLEAAVR